jgi:hypothetical protein
MPSFTAVGHLDITTNSSYKIIETSDGVLVALPDGNNAITWAQSIRAEGSDCGNFDVGPAQMIWKYQATVNWRVTRWKYSLPRLPIRDVDRGYLSSPWYNPTLVQRFTKCAEEKTVMIADRPAFGPVRSQPPGYNFPSHGMIPWNDPRTGEVNSLRSINWDISFVAYLVAQDRTKNVFVKPPLKHLYWSIQFAADFKNGNPLGRRANIRISRVQRSNVRSGDTSDSPVDFTGPNAYGTTGLGAFIIMQTAL